jgi:tRNA(fMet)-specific endonuclease VapC
MKYVLDTNTLIYYFKGVGNIATQLLATPPNDIGIPTIVIYELEVWIAKSVYPRKRKAQLQEFISLVNIFPFSYAEAKCATDIRVKLEKKGSLIGPYDILIAASAMANNNILVTHNQREFQRIRGLKLEDWY